MRKVLVGICLTLLISIIYVIPVKADVYNDIVYEPFDIEIEGTTGWDYTSLGEAYMDLTNSQKEIVQYLIGLYNYMYMGARGFKYNGINTDTELQARLKAFGNRLIYGDGFFGWRSRVNETFRQYMSAIIIYASNIRHYDGHEVTFDEWWTNIVHGGHKLYIPYTTDALDAWTDFYNDPSNDGIVSFGEWETDWSSGQYFDFGFENLNFYSSSDENRYNDFILNNSPVLFSDTVNNSQWVMSLKDITYPDSIYIVRRQGNEYYQRSYYGYSNNRLQEYIMIPACNLGLRSGQVVSEVYTYRLNAGYFNFSTPLTLRDIINETFKLTPFNDLNNQSPNFFNCYPFVEHVYLVDDIETFANKEELIPEVNLDIDNSRTGWYLETTNGNWYYYDGDPSFQDPDIIENSYKDDGNGNLVPTDGNDFSRQIVNNTVINNYYVVSPGQEINVPVNWFERGQGYLDVLWGYTEPFTVFVSDVFNSLGDIKIVLLGCLILAIAGGVIVKFLL